MQDVKRKILVIEDESSIQTIVERYLSAAGYAVTSAYDGLAGLRRALTETFDLLIIDVNLPGVQGYEIVAQVRQVSDVYIIMLTARGEEADEMRGFRAGADDYVTKPFSPRALVARVDAAMRRRRDDAPADDGDLCFAHVCINAERYQCWTPDGEIGLTQTEFKLLLALMRHPGYVLSRDQLLERVWGHNFHGNERVVDVYVGQVRRKLEAATGVSLIETIRGVGYRFDDEAA